MDLTQTADQDAIQESVRAFLDAELPLSRVREIASGASDGFDSLWKKAGELGFFGLALPESEGGAGYSLAEELVLFEQLGRALAPGPWLGSVVASHALAGATSSALVALRRDLVQGARRVALIDAGEKALQANGRLSGRFGHVADAGVADHLLVLHGSTASLVARDAKGVAVRQRPSLDLTRPVAEVVLEEAEATELDCDGAALRRIAIALACAEAVGGIRRTVELSVEYAKTRQQFGKPIGSFQAVKHRCADMAVRAEAARSATIYAAISVRDATPDQDFQLDVAKLLCTNAYLQNGADNIQNHGGMGFTWECDAHLFLKRARSFELTLGSRQVHLDSMVARFRA